MPVSKKVMFGAFNVFNIIVTIFQIYYIIQAFQHFGVNNYASAILAFLLICFNSYFLSRLENTPITAVLKIVVSIACIAFIFVGAYLASHVHIVLAIILSIWTIIANVIIFLLSTNNQNKAP